jgi:hypothetical protein
MTCEHIDSDEAMTECCATWRNLDDLYTIDTPDGTLSVCAAGRGCNV